MENEGKYLRKQGSTIKDYCLNSRKAAILSELSRMQAPANAIKYLLCMLTIHNMFAVLTQS